jgi:hypothetical protein
MIGTRTFLAVLIGISLVVSPVTGGAGVSMWPINMSMSDNKDMPCCPSDESKGSFTCAFKCFNFQGALFPTAISLPDIVDLRQPLLADETLHGHISQPTHPPPI